jgi:hypothetical protein
MPVVGTGAAQASRGYEYSWLWVPGRASLARDDGSRFNFQRAKVTHPRDADTPGFCAEHIPPKIRGRRECRVSVAPAASRAECKEHTSVVTVGSPDWPGIPRAMVLRLIARSPR